MVRSNINPLFLANNNHLMFVKHLVWIRNKVKTGRKRCTRHNYQDDLHEHIGHRQTIHSFSFSASSNFLTNFKLFLITFLLFMLYLATEIFFGLSLLLSRQIREKKPSYTVNYIFNCGHLKSLGTSEVQLRASSPRKSLLAGYSEVRKTVTFIL